MSTLKWFDVDVELEAELDAHAEAVSSGAEPDRDLCAARAGLKVGKLHGTPKQIQLRGDVILVHFEDGTSLKMQLLQTPKSPMQENPVIEDVNALNEPEPIVAEATD